MPPHSPSARPWAVGSPASGWSAPTDAELLARLALEGSGSVHGAAELHRRHAPPLYALARQRFQGDPEPHVQDALCRVVAHAHCHARSLLDGRAWIVATALRCWAAPAGERVPAGQPAAPDAGPATLER